MIVVVIRSENKAALAPERSDCRNGSHAGLVGLPPPKPSNLRAMDKGKRRLSFDSSSHEACLHGLHDSSLDAVVLADARACSSDARFCCNCAALARPGSGNSTSACACLVSCHCCNKQKKRRCDSIEPVEKAGAEPEWATTSFCLRPQNSETSALALQTATSPTKRVYSEGDSFINFECLMRNLMK